MPKPEQPTLTVSPYALMPHNQFLTPKKIIWFWAEARSFLREISRWAALPAHKLVQQIACVLFHTLNKTIFVKICHFINPARVGKICYLKSPESFRSKSNLCYHFRRILQYESNKMFILAYRKLKKLFCTEINAKNCAHSCEVRISTRL